MKTTAYTHFEKTIIDNIDFDAYGYSNECSLYDKIKTAYNIFKDEYTKNDKRQLSEKTLFKEWLMGLPSTLSVPFYYHDIILNAENAGIKIKNEEQFCSDYWDNLTNAFFTLKENL